MPLVTLQINGRSYEMTCDEGQEGHLQKLAEHIDERMRELASAVGQVGETRLLVMTSLLIADELYEAYRQIHTLEERGDEAPEPVGNGADAAAAQALEACAARIEAIAARLGKA